MKWTNALKKKLSLPKLKQETMEKSQLPSIYVIKASLLKETTGPSHKTGEFYKMFKKEIIPIFTNSLKEKMIPNSFVRAA